MKQRLERIGRMSLAWLMVVLGALGASMAIAIYAAIVGGVIGTLLGTVVWVIRWFIGGAS